MKLWFPCCLLPVALLASCASPGGSPTSTPGPIPEPEATPAWQTATAGGLGVGADPYLDTDRQNAVFGDVLTAVGVLPVRLRLENRGDGRFIVRPEQVTLTLADGTQVHSVEGRVVAARVDPSVPSRYQPTFGVMQSPVVSVFELALGLITAAHAKARLNDQAARQDRFAASALKEVTLAPGEVAHGFVFFVRPPGMVEATLSVTAVGAGAETAPVVFRLPLAKLPPMR